MSYGEPRFRIRTKVIAVAAVVAAIVIPVVGPFTFYETVVPYLTPVIPKPDGAPSDAEARHSWKGPGLYWEWERELPLGCASWMLAEDRWVSVGFAKGEHGCTDAESRFGFANYRHDYVNFGRTGSGTRRCSVHTSDVSSEELVEILTFLSQAEDAAKGEAERRLIALSNEWLTQPEPDEGEHPCGQRYPNMNEKAD